MFLVVEALLVELLFYLRLIEDELREVSEIGPNGF
jgi:hypothetical protein